MKIELITAPSSQEIDFLTQRINQETPHYGAAYSFAFFGRDENNQIVAGCNGSVVFGAIYTDQLWVALEHRQKKLGKELMERVHEYGREVGCTMATVCTMTFQGAQAFYEKLGYAIDFKREGYLHNSCMIALSRQL